MVNFSYEVFPPVSEDKQDEFIATVKNLSSYNPKFISVTCTAKDRKDTSTLKVLEALKKEISTPLAVHLICSNKTKEEVREMALHYWEMGVRHIIALRGDAPVGEKYVPKEDGYGYANELVQALKELRDFKISVAGYPETHYESLNIQSDIDYLKAKVDAGADNIISQFFFDPEVFLRFRDRVVKAGIEVPILPGILPILNFKGLIKFATRCQTNVPSFLHDMFKDFHKDSLDHKLLAMNVLSHQITKLMSEGVEDYHLYSLNQSEIVTHASHWLKTAF